MQRIVPLLAAFLLFPCFAIEKVDSKDKHQLEPEHVLINYFQACRQGQLETAAAMVWLKDDATPTSEAPRFEEVQRRIKRENWNVRVVAKAVDIPFAALVFTTRKDRSDPEPILLIKVDGEWKLYHDNVSGHIAARIPDHEMGKLEGLTRWGHKWVRDYKLRKRESTPTQPPAAP